MQIVQKESRERERERGKLFGDLGSLLHLLASRKKALVATQIGAVAAALGALLQVCCWLVGVLSGEQSREGFGILLI